MAGAPVILGKLALQACCDQMATPIAYVELFSGARSITKAMWNDGRLAIPYDVTDDERFEDFLSDAGFCYALRLILGLEGGGGLWAGIVCSTWVPLNLGTSGRRKWRPEGNSHYASVQRGNQMAARLALLLLLCDAIGLWWTVEQPRGSLLFYHPRLQHVLRKVQVFKVAVMQWDFGASSPKPTWLFSNRAWIADVAQHKILRQSFTKTVLVTTSTKADGSKAYQGNKNTKQSQNYPPAFGVAIAKLYRQHDGDLKREYNDLRERVDKFAAGKDYDVVLSSLAIDVSCPKPGWTDAKLDDVFTYLSCDSGSTRSDNPGCAGS